VLYLLAARLCTAAEAAFLLAAITPGQGPLWIVLMAMLMQATTQLIDWIGAFVPGRVGVAEGGVALLFELRGKDPVTGLSVELLRRARKVLGIAIGIVIGGVVELRHRPRTPQGS
jgi:hypothetical protein